jgi:hypothetical protein
MASTLVFQGVQGSIIDCSHGTSRFQLQELSLTPERPVPGEELYMNVVFTNPGSEVDDGSVTTDVTLNFIPFAPSTVALCDSTECPLVSGLNNRSTSSIWPSTIAGKIVSKIVWRTLEEEELLCIQISVSVGPLLKLRGSHNHNHPVHPDRFAERLWKWQGPAPRLKAKAKAPVSLSPYTNLTIYRPLYRILDDTIFPEDLYD